MLATDRLMYMTNALKGTRNFFVSDPATGAVLNGPSANGFDALTLVGAPAADRVDRSAISLSAEGTQAMFNTNAAYFGAVGFSNMSTGVKTAGIQLGGTGQLCQGSAPFINNSAYPGLDSLMEVWCSTTNAAGTTGYLHKLTYVRGRTPAEWTYGGALTVSGPAADGTAGTVSAAGFTASPIAWNGKVYIGDMAGRLWEYTIATGAARYWDLSPFSGVASAQIIAPAAININWSDDVEDIFVSCGNRVFWVDPVANTMTPSVVLAVDKQAATTPWSTNLQGGLDTYAFTGVTKPDIYGTEAWSMGSNFNPSNNTYGNELVGAYGYATPTDGKPVTGYMRFDVPANAFGGVPISAKLWLTCDPFTISNGSDVGSIFRCSNFLRNATTGLDTTTKWTAALLDNNNGWKQQPRLLVPNPFSSRNGPVTNGVRYAWNISGAVPRDNDTYTFAIRGKDKQYASAGAAPNGVAPGYYGTEDNAGGANPSRRRPALEVLVSNYGMAGAIRAQPILLFSGAQQFVCVANSNAVFQLEFTNNGAFTSTASTLFSLLEGGRTGGIGPVTAGKFVQNNVTTSLSMTGSQFYLYVCDDNGLGTPHLNKFKMPLTVAPNADDLVQVYNMPAGSLRSTPFLTWDFLGGSLYFADQGGLAPSVLPKSTLYRLPQ
jgi:hypothetical protein